jgi:hypothetical protein
MCFALHMQLAQGTLQLLDYLLDVSKYDLRGEITTDRRKFQCTFQLCLVNNARDGYCCPEDSERNDASFGEVFYCLS